MSLLNSMIDDDDVMIVLACGCDMIFCDVEYIFCIVPDFHVLIIHIEMHSNFMCGCVIL